MGMLEVPNKKDRRDENLRPNHQRSRCGKDGKIPGQLRAKSWLHPAKPKEQAPTELNRYNA